MIPIRRNPDLHPLIHLEIRIAKDDGGQKEAAHIQLHDGFHTARKDRVDFRLNSARRIDGDMLRSDAEEQLVSCFRLDSFTRRESQGVCAQREHELFLSCLAHVDRYEVDIRISNKVCNERIGRLFIMVSGGAYC